MKTFIKAGRAGVKALLIFQKLLTAPLAGIYFILNLFNNFGKRPGAQPGDYIFGQGRLRGERLYLAKAEKTVCEVAAIYNALIYFGIPAPLKSVKRAFLRSGALTLLFFGFFGGNPYSLSRPAKKFGLKLSMAKPEDIKDGGAVISFFNPSSLSLHTVFTSVSGGKFSVYNLYSSDTRPRGFSPGTLGDSLIVCYKAENKKGKNHNG